MNNKPFHTILFTLTVSLLLLVLMQSLTHWIPMKPLEGYTNEAELQKDTLKMKSIMDGTYQNYLSEYTKRNTGFREFFIRAYNQLIFSVFNQSTNDNIIKGSNNELYMRMYLQDITGEKVETNFGTVEEAKKEAQSNVKATVEFMELLQRHGTKFFFVFCPSKAYVYPEFMPKKYQKRIADFQLAEYYIQLFEENNIPYIDFYHYFKDIKDEYPYPLYAKTGSHWSEATIPMVCDSIYRKMEEVMDIRLPKVKVTDLNPTSDYSNSEAELESTLNLLFPMRKPALPRPHFVLDDTLGKDKPNLLVIGDSYFNQIRLTDFVKAFNEWDFWVYNKDIYSSRPFYNQKKLSMVFDANEVLEEADVVMAMFTSVYLPRYMFGFIPYAEKQLTEGTSFEEAVAMIIKNIKENPEWFHSVQQQATERGITLEENLRSNAEYVYYNTLRAKKELSNTPKP